MNVYSPIHAYVFGAAGLGLGLHACLRPRQEYPRFGLRLESTRAPHPREKATIAKPDADAEPGSVSPLIYLKATREATYGLALIGLQYQGNAAGVTTVVAIVALAALGDGIVVWCHAGSKELRRKAWGHWAVFAGLAGWAGWRTFLWYGELAAFHALHV